MLEWDSIDIDDFNFPFPKRASVEAYYDPRAMARFVKTITWTAEVTRLEVIDPNPARFVIDPRMAWSILTPEPGEQNLGKTGVAGEL